MLFPAHSVGHLVLSGSRRLSQRCDYEGKNRSCKSALHTHTRYQGCLEWWKEKTFLLWRIVMVMTQ